MKVLKWLGILVGACLVLACLGYAGIYVASNRFLHKARSVPTAAVAIPTDSAAIAHGRHLAEAVNKCTDCHGDDLGGKVFLAAGPFATIVAPNLTRGAGGIAAHYNDADWERAVRHGIGGDGRALAIMPAEAFQFLSDADLGAVLAYVRSVPAVDRTLPATSFGPIGRMLIARKKLPMFPVEVVNHARTGYTYPAADTSTEYGHYLANIGGCTSCHNPAMSGGPNPAGPPNSPPPANLTPGGKPQWTEAEFLRTLREGKTQDGRDIDVNFMPWRSSGRMTDAEIHAVYRWLRSLPAKELGQR